MFRNFFSPPPPPPPGWGPPPNLPPRNNPSPPPPPPPRHPPQATTGPGAGPNQQLECLAQEGMLTKYTQFFVLKASDSFAACNNCYQSKLVPHASLAHEFRPYHTANDEQCFSCDLCVPRVLAILRSQCIPYNTVQPLLDFVRLSETLTPCDGSVISAPGPYYATRNQAIDGFAACVNCFERYLHHTPFEHGFERIPDGTFGGTQHWTCDMAMPFFRRLVLSRLESERPDFAEFIEEGKARMPVPPCPGAGKPITQFAEAVTAVLFTATGDKTGNICFACYCDSLSNTSLENAFVPARLTQEQLGKVTCDLAGAYSKMAMEFAIKHTDDEIWRGPVGLAGKVGDCRGKRGTDGEELEKEKAQGGSLADWYQLNEAPDVEVCPHCYWLKIKLFGAAHLFSPITRTMPPGAVRMCYLTGSDTPEDTPTNDRDKFEDSMAWRGRLMFKSLRPGYEAGEWSPLIAVSRSVATGPPPCAGPRRGFKRPSGRRWFGRISANVNDPTDCTIVFCEECYARAVDRTPHASLFGNDLTDQAYAAEGPTGFVCQTYTNRARGMLRTAAQQGDLASFARWWNHRDQLRKKRDSWKPILDAQLMKQKMANFQQSQQMLLKVNAQANALSRIGAAGIVEAAMSDPGERWGNSQVGYDHWTQGSADAEQDWQNANKLTGGTGAGTFAVMAETQRIFAMAQVDENAFVAVE